MKKIHVMIAALLAFLPTMLFGGSSYYYAYVKATRGEGCGKVYASVSTTSNPAYVAGDSTSDSQGAKDKKGTSYKFYVYAQNKYGYKFKTWEPNPPTVTDNQSSGKGSATISNATTEKGALVTVTTGNYSFGDNGGTQNTTASVTATYEPCTDVDPHYTLTMGNNAGTGSYTFSGTVGFPSIAPGGNARVWFNDVVSFSVTPADGYDFVRWCREDANGKSYYSDATLANQSFTSDTTISAEFKQQVVCHAICLASEGGTYKAGTEMVSGGNVDVQNYAEVSVTMSSPTASEGYEFYGWFKLHENGVKEYLSYYPSAQVKVTSREDVTIGAEFVRKEAILLRFEAPADGSLTYKIASASPVTVDGEDATESCSGSVSVTLSATSVDGNRVPKWYVKDEAGAKSYFAITPTATRTVTASETIGVDFIAQNTVLVHAIDTVKDGGTVTLDRDAEIVYGTTLTIPSGVTVDLGGHTLYIDGTLVNNGAIQNGTISKCAKLIRQTGNGLGPIVADNISYWDTRIENYTATAPGSSATHLTIINGYGTSIRGTMENASPAAIVCQIDISAGAAVNTITNYVADYSKTGGGNGGAIYAAGKTADNTGKIVVQLENSVKLTMTDFPAQTGWRYTSGGKEDSSKIGQGYRIDCAHNSIEVTYGVSNSSTTYFINASTAQRTSSLLNSATENFINCQTVSQRINVSSASYSPRANFYDCGTPTITFDGSNKLTTDGCGVNFRSGGPYTTPSTTNNYHVYSGFFTAEPPLTIRASTLVGTHKFYQHADGYWYLEPIQDPNVAEIGGAKKLYLEDAFADATAEEGLNSTITILRNCTLTNSVVIPKRVKVRVELAGCKITAPKGFVVNSGELEIGDKYGNLTTSGVEVERGNLFVNENEGKIDVAYGKYSGDILLKSGSEFTTHHGRFDGAITFDDGVVDKSSVAKLRGGIFAADVTDCLAAGYDQKNGYVGAFPYANIEDCNVTGYEAGYAVQAMSNEYLGLYTSANVVRDGSYTAADWFRRAELFSMTAPYLGYTIDCVVKFDRDVAANSVTAYGETVIGFSQKLDQAVAAGAEYRAISKKVASSSYYQISYSRFITDNDVNSLVCALKSDSNDNIGTTCRFNLDLCSGANKYDVSKLKSVYTIGSRSYVFGAGDNIAMLQTAEGAVPAENFFATLEAAVASDATTGKAIKLCNDCTEQVTVTKACTIDANGFAFTGSVNAAEGYAVASSEDGVYVVVDLVSKVDVATVVSEVVSENWMVANNIEANASPEVIQEKLKEEDANGNARWENLVIGQKADEAAAVTAANGGTASNVTVAVTFSVPTNAVGATVNTGYTVKYAFDKVDTNGDVVDNGEGAAQDKPTLDIKSVTAKDGPSYFKMRAVLEASDDSNVTAEVPVEKTIGVVKVASDAEVTIIPVPWQSLGDTDIKATELVHAASLSNDDELIVYGTDGKSQTWIVKNGEWTAPAAEHIIDSGDSEPQKVEAQDPAELKRGQGVILKRKDPSKEIVLIGQPVASEEDVETPIAAATDDEPSWNLVASPKMAEVNISAAFTEEKGNTSDEIIVPTAGTPKHYTYKNGAWGYPGGKVTEEVNHPALGAITVIKTEHKTGDTTINAGTGFWYLNKGTSKSINW